MKKVILNAKVDPILKERAQKVAAELDIPLSTVITNALRMFVMNKSVTIQVPVKDEKRPDGIDEHMVTMATVLAAKKRKVTVALLQRKLKIGYQKANALIEVLQDLRVIDSENNALVSSRQTIDIS